MQHQIFNFAQSPRLRGDCCDFARFESTDALFQPDHAALKSGFSNLKWHIDNAQKYGLPVVVAINQFPQDANFRPLYRAEQTLEDKIITVCTKGYGCGEVQFSETAKQQLALYQTLGFGELAVCMAKTPLSISSDSSLKGAPSGFTIMVREVRLCAGAGFVYALTGNVMTMPGLPDIPAFMALDIDENGDIVGLMY